MVGDEEAYRESDVGTGLMMITFLYLGLSLTTIHGFRGDIVTGGTTLRRTTVRRTGV
ncbi:MAG TPA: hypothetical protein PLG75_04575 [Methanoculleus sp.]|nr:hypothetical protein [Methanoculleus sp.]